MLIILLQVLSEHMVERELSFTKALAQPTASLSSDEVRCAFKFNFLKLLALIEHQLQLALIVLQFKTYFRSHFAASF